MKKIILLLSILATSSMSAKNPAQKDTVDDLNEVVVTATRTQKLLKNVPIITRVITADEIKRTDATNMQDLIQQELPGAEFSYTMGSQPSLNFQGFDGKDVLFLIDGERLAGETLDNVDFTRINMDNVERIEIVKGAASSLYGSNAVGGVINVITKKPHKPWAVNVNAKRGAHNEQRYGGTAAFKTGKFTSSTNIQKASQDELNFKGSSAYKAYGYDSWNIKEKMSYKFGKHFDLDGKASYFIRDRHYSANQENRFRDFSGGLKGNYTFDESSKLELGYNYDQYDKSDYYYDKYDILDYRNVQHTVRTMFTHDFNSDLNWIVGGDFVRDYLKTYQFADTAGKHQETADLFTQADWNITKKLNVIGGVRYDYFSAADINHATAKAALLYKALEELRLRASYAGGFRAPTLKETDQEFLMGGFMYIYGNKELKPEQSNNFQASAEYTKGPWDFTLSGFCNLFNNRISTRYDSLYYQGKPITSEFRSNYSKDELNDICRKKDEYAIYENRDELTITGLNADVKARFKCGINASVSYVYTHESNTVTSSTRPHAANMKLEYHKDWENYGFNIGLTGRYMSELNAEGEHYGDYSIWKLSLMQNIYKGIHLNLVLDNLFNYTPSSYSSVSPSTTGTTFSASLSVDIDELVDHRKEHKLNAEQ